jgi:hypothetical protein
MASDELRHDYVHCVECSAGNAVSVMELFGQEIAFRRFGGDHTDMWAKNEDGWHCPSHAHIAMGMDREEFETLRDNDPREADDA